MAEMRRGAIRMLCLLWFGVMPAAVAAADFDLAGYRQRAATDRAAGIAEGRNALDAGVFRDDPASERTLLWYMGGAAVGMPDDVALGEVVLRLESLAASRGDEAAASFAGFLRGARLLDVGQTGEGLAEVLRAANRLAGSENESLRITAASELCRAYVGADRAEQALEHCRRHTLLVSQGDDAVALARAEYIEASVHSQLRQHGDAIPLWRSARQRFLDHGLDVLAERAAGSLAGDLVAEGRFNDALELANQSVLAADRAGNRISACIARGTLAEALAGLGRRDEALREIGRAVADMEDIDHPGVLARLLRIEIGLIESIPDAAPRVAALRERIAGLSMAAVSDQEVAVITDLEQRYRQREQDLRIRELEQENRSKELALEASRGAAERQAQALREQRLVTGLWGVASLALFLLLVAAAVVLRAQRRVAAGLREQAYRDALTALPNRRALYERVQALLAEPGAESRGHALTLIDVDRFKEINDRGGHPFGDAVLAGIARCLHDNAPADGMVARLGGEEFVMLCPDFGLDAACRHAERVRLAVRALDVRLAGEAVALSISQGVAIFDGKRCRDLSSWLNEADLAAYRAKDHGRDCVETQVQEA